MGIAVGYATLGQIGFEGRVDLSADWTVSIPPAQMSLAPGEQRTVTPRAYAATVSMVRADCIGDLSLKGFLKPVTVYNILELKEKVAEL